MTEVSEDTVHGRRRRRQEASIRVIDMIVYAVAVVGGFITPNEQK